MLVEHLISENIFCCPYCRHFPLEWSHISAKCPRCFKVYTRKSGTVDFIHNYDPSFKQFRKASHAFVRTVSRHFGFPDSAQVHLAISDAIEATQLVVKGSGNLTAEIRELASRMKLTENVWEDDILTDPPSKDTTPAYPPDIAFEQYHFSHNFPLNQEIYRSIRIRNQGQSAIPYDPEEPFCLSYHWLDLNKNVIEYEGMRSPLPRELSINDAVTVITRIRTPAIPGKYILRFCLMQEFVAWFDYQYLDIPINISDQALPPLENLERYDQPFDYDNDVNISKQLLIEQFGNASNRILEIAGGIFPQSIALINHNCQIISIDISFAMSQLGSLYYQYVDSRFSSNDYCFLAADALSLPFRAGQFNGIIICAALHHFPDPIKLLKELSYNLCPDGAIVIIREPCQPNPWDTDYLSDIRKGINEQMWTLEEYDFIFKSAGLRAVAGRIDSLSSLKVVLKKA